MTRYIAFLRAINVGGHVVKMERLRELFTTMKLSEVETFIASGNVIFTTSARDVRALEGRIEASLQTSLGYRVAVFLRSAEELAGVVARAPSRNASWPVEATSLYIGFLAAGVDEERAQRVAALSTSTDELQLVDRELYWYVRDRFSDSKITGAKLERVIDGEITIRNVTTVRKLAEKYG
jgi:uncharacterized protein (DUF1697 family)